MAHLHEVRDTDTHYVIDPITMAITNANDAKNKLMLGDHDSEIYTFEIPKVVEGHDMTLCNKIEVHFINVSADKTGKSANVYPVDDVSVEVFDPATNQDAEDMLVFSWTVSGNATKYAGTLNFRIKFACTDENGNYTYVKWTDIYKGITVADGFDNGEAVVEEYSDIIAEWESRLDALEQQQPSLLGAVLYTEQTLTEEQKAQARKNIGATGKDDVPDNSAKAQFKNIRFGFIGDSQTERNQHKTVTWGEQITDRMGVYSNFGYSGFTVAKNANNNNYCFGMLVASLTKAVDVVLVMGGVNDVWFNSPLGEFGSTDNTTFYGAMDELCSALINKYPTKTIVFITPTEQDNEDCTADNTTGLTATDFAQAMKKVCAKYAIPVYDANALSGIYPLNESQAAAYTTDGLHLNDTGSERLGKQVAAFLQNHCHIATSGVFFDGIGDVNYAYLGDGCLSADFAGNSGAYGAVQFPGVTKMTIDTSKYTLPMKNYAGLLPGWFALKQADGTYKALTPCYDAAGGLDALRGEAWDFDANGKNPTNKRTRLWDAPTSYPAKIEVVLADGTAKMYFDTTEVYSMPCIELGYIASMLYHEMDGLTLTYAEET